MKRKLLGAKSLCHIYHGIRIWYVPMHEIETTSKWNIPWILRHKKNEVKRRRWLSLN